MIVAHAGADEFESFFDLCGVYEGVFLDTAMVFNRFLGGPPPIQRVLEFQDRVVFGSDFPQHSVPLGNGDRGHPGPATGPHAGREAAVHERRAAAGDCDLRSVREWGDSRHAKVQDWSGGRLPIG